MSQVKVRITATDTKILNFADYQQAWEEHCDYQGEMEEGDDYPPITKTFVLETFQANLEDGTEDLSVVMERADLDVRAIE